VIPIALALLRGDHITTLGLFFAAAVSDAADGFLAKRFGWRTTLGGILDPAADTSVGAAGTSARATSALPIPFVPLPGTRPVADLREYLGECTGAERHVRLVLQVQVALRFHVRQNT